MAKRNSPDYPRSLIRNYQTKQTSRDAVEDTGVSASEVHGIDRIEDTELKEKIRVRDQLIRICREYEINQQHIGPLRTLTNFQIIILCDNSGTMRTQIGDTLETRWDKVVRFVRVLFEFCSIFNPDGVEIRFVSGEKFQVNDPETLDEKLRITPSDYTRLVPILKEIFESEPVPDKNLLVFVATDGNLTNRNGNSDIPALKSIMRETRRENAYVSFLVCNDNYKCVDYLNRWYKKMKNIDVTYEFGPERRKFRDRSRRSNRDYTKGDYIVKLLLGAIYRDIYRYIQNH